jgi:hypothetical protein
MRKPVRPHWVSLYDIYHAQEATKTKLFVEGIIARSPYSGASSKHTFIQLVQELHQCTIYRLFGSNNLSVSVIDVLNLPLSGSLLQNIFASDFQPPNILHFSRSTDVLLVYALDCLPSYCLAAWNEFLSSILREPLGPVVLRVDCMRPHYKSPLMKGSRVIHLRKLSDSEEIADAVEG